MSGVVISSGFVVTSSGDINSDNPIIGYHNLVTSANVTATTASTDFPATNVANPSTYLRWKAADGSPIIDEYITVTLDTPEQVDYLAIARHNFGTNLNAVSVEGLAEEGSPENWTELVADSLLSDDGPVIFRFTKQSLYAIRLRIQISQAASPALPFVAVIYVGELLTSQRRLYVGHTPMPMGRNTKLANHMSIDGEFLGRVVLGRKLATSVELSNLTPSWYRENFDAFVVAAQEIPFFFGWRPNAYPFEVGYAWLTGDPKPANSLANGMMNVSLNLEGIA